MIWDDRTTICVCINVIQQKDYRKKKSRMKLIMIIRRLGSLSIILPVISKIISSKRSGPQVRFHDWNIYNFRKDFLLLYSWRSLNVARMRYKKKKAHFARLKRLLVKGGGVIIRTNVPPLTFQNDSPPPPLSLFCACCCNFFFQICRFLVQHFFLPEFKDCRDSVCHDKPQNKVSIKTHNPAA